LKEFNPIDNKSDYKLINYIAGKQISPEDLEKVQSLYNFDDRSAVLNLFNKLNNSMMIKKEQPEQT
jgi:hypothetical protein